MKCRRLTRLNPRIPEAGLRAAKPVVGAVNPESCCWPETRRVHRHFMGYRWADGTSSSAQAFWDGRVARHSKAQKRGAGEEDELEMKTSVCQPNSLSSAALTAAAAGAIY